MIAITYNARRFMAPPEPASKCGVFSEIPHSALRTSHVLPASSLSAAKSRWLDKKKGERGNLGGFRTLPIRCLTTANRRVYKSRSGKSNHPWFVRKGARRRNSTDSHTPGPFGSYDFGIYGLGWLRLLSRAK